MPEKTHPESRANRPKGITSLLGILMFSLNVHAEPETTLKIGSLALGTLNWELAIMRSRGLDKAHQLNLETRTLASPDAGRIALQGNSVDIIVGDWIWVARQRLQGQDFTFSPFSSSHGALMVPAESPIHGIADLEGKRLGVAGGGLDKNWLLLKAAAQKIYQIDLEKKATITFGAPPLLNQELQHGKLDAVFNYWNHAAKLEALGYRQVLDGDQIQQSLGIKTDVPALGYVFRESWAKQHLIGLEKFLQATTEARRMICESESAWEEVAPLTQETNPAILSSLRQHYCSGRVVTVAEGMQDAARQIFNQVENAKDATRKPASEITLPAGIFWTRPRH